ncbi:hypothetical protein KY347_07070 [Candidatus Woesearchaeota archaeon]|nr:hypothetical protein [Candidatus Woesearchaeota archaeon]
MKKKNKRPKTKKPYSGTKNILTVIALAIFLILLIKYALLRSKWVLDVSASIILLLFFFKFYDRLHQDSVSYFCLIFMMALHDLSLYSETLFGLKFENYMHFIGGFTIAIITDRFFKEKLGKAKRFITLLIFALGVGAIVEITEWLGFKILGAGEGLFYFGAGDIDAWHNTIIDLIFNAFGAAIMGTSALSRKK